MGYCAWILKEEGHFEYAFSLTNFLHIVQTGSGVHPTSYPKSSEGKKMWMYTSTPPYAFMAYCSVKHREN
jgi:hypothetical protein